MSDQPARDQVHEVEEICEAALERPSDDRAQFLDLACGDDSALRAEVESLLGYDDSSGFIDRTALEVAAEELAAVLPGSMVGRYTLLGPLGSGGMGDVYRARDTLLERDVAVKLLPNVFATDPRRRLRLEREARLLASLNHPHIAAAYDFESGPGVSALVLELVEGETLEQLLTRRQAAGAGGMPVADALDLACQIADALEAAHRTGIVHQDLKPANTVIRPDGQLKVLDFGVAAVLPGCDNLPLPAQYRPPAANGIDDGLFFGTPAYMSPEQWRRRVDPKSDIWAFGCILFEMLTLRPAVACDAPDERPSLVTIGASSHLLDAYLPPPIMTLLTACLEREAWARPDARAVHRMVRMLQDRMERNWTHSRDGIPFHSLAVLPVAAGEEVSLEEFLREGLAEQISERLSPLPQLKVIAANTVFRYHAVQADPRIIALQLGVEGALVSRFVPAADGVRLIVELVDPLEAAPVWNTSYPVSVDAIETLAELITSDVAQALGMGAAQHRPRPPIRAAAASPEAYRAYLKGRFHWNKRTADGFVRALDCFNDAVRLNPDFALAFVAIADCYAVLPLYDEASPRQAYEHAKAAIDRALVVDPDLPEAHAALGHVRFSYEWDWTGAEDSLQRAVALDRGNVGARHVLANFLTATGRLTEARREFDMALALDPVSLPLNADEGLLSYFERDYDGAIDQFSKTLELDRHFASAHAFLGWAYAHRQEYELALESGHTALKLSDSSWIRASLGYTHALAGDIGAARAVLRDLQHRAENTYVSPYDLAILHALLGDHDRALASLLAARDERSAVLVWGAVNDPWLDSVRELPPFQQLLEEMGLRRGASGCG